MVIIPCQAAGRDGERTSGPWEASDLTASAFPRLGRQPQLTAKAMDTGGKTVLLWKVIRRISLEFTTQWYGLDVYGK